MISFSVDQPAAYTALGGRADARGIHVANVQPNDQGVATVDPIVTRARLAQRIPVRIELEAAPKGVVLVAGTTATVEVQPEAAPLR